MRIGICGAQSVGKTTLLNALRSERLFSDFKVCNEVTRRVNSYGLPINENGSDNTQRLIMHEHIVNVFMNNHFITDRTALDGVVYTHYLHENGKVSDETMTYVSDIFFKLIPYYDRLFYIRPEFEIKNDGIRSIDLKFRDRIVELFEEYIDSFLLVTVVRGSVRERVDIIMNEVRAKCREQEEERNTDCDY